jgi:predicted DNA-binding protein
MSTDKTTTTFQLPQELHNQFKLECVKQGKSMSEIIELLITKYINNNGKIK